MDNNKALIEVMLELLRSAVLDHDPNIESYSEVNWDKLMDLSSSQGVLAWVWDGICKLPKEQQPPRLQRINWSLSAQEIWDRYAKQKAVLADMVKVCEENNMRLLLLKGIGLSELYPKPESRPSGDIDVYFFDDFEKGNQLFCNDFAPIFKKKHSEFMFEGVLIENHLKLLDEETLIRKNAADYIIGSLCDVTKDKIGIFKLSEMPGLVYLLLHLLHHFRPNTMVPLRMFVDIYMFSRECLTDSQMNECVKKLDELQLLDAYRFVISISESLLGESLSSLHNSGVSKIEVDASRLKNYVRLWNYDDESVLQKSIDLWGGYLATNKLCKYVFTSPSQYLITTIKRQFGLVFKPLFHIPSDVFFMDGIKVKIYKIFRINR